MGYFPVSNDSRVVIYERKMFIRLATGISSSNPADRSVTSIRAIIVSRGIKIRKPHKGGARPVWSDLAKFRHFGKMLKVFGNSSRSYLVFLPNFQPTLAIFMPTLAIFMLFSAYFGHFYAIFRQILVAVNGQKLEVSLLLDNVLD